MHRQPRFELVSSCRSALVFMSGCFRKNITNSGAIGFALVFLLGMHFSCGFICRSGNLDVCFSCHLEPHRIQPGHHSRSISSSRRQQLIPRTLPLNFTTIRPNSRILSDRDGSTAAATAAANLTYAYIHKRNACVLCSPFSTCDAPGVLSQPYPEGESCSMYDFLISHTHQRTHVDDSFQISCCTSS